MSYEFEVDKRPVSSWKLSRELCAWLKLGLCSDKFDGETCLNIISSYHKNVKCNGKDKECLSVNQYKTLYRVYSSYRIESVFKNFNEKYKWTCINLSNIELVKPIICCETNEEVTDVYFEVLEQGKYSVCGFENVFSEHLNHHKYKTETKKEPKQELTTEDADFE